MSRRRIRSWDARSAPPRMGAPGGWTAPPSGESKLTPKIPTQESSEDRSPRVLFILEEELPLPPFTDSCFFFFFDNFTYSWWLHDAA
jgi:hypothetical protein